MLFCNIISLLGLVVGRFILGYISGGVSAVGWRGNDDED